jgi:hypothetical protein
LPDKVAVHFNALGQADQWATKLKFSLFNIGMLFGVAVLFEIIICFLPRVPENLMNIPYRAYWMAPERREKTIERMVRYLWWTADLTMLFLFGTDYLVTQANYYHTYQLGRFFWAMLFLYLLAIGLITVDFLLRFFRKPNQE